MTIKVGDSLWIPRTDRKEEEEQVPCPVCFGKKSVTLILGDDSCIELDCDYCAKGYSAPRGFVTDYTLEPRAELFIVHGITTKESASDTVIEYSSGCYIAHDGDLFPTKEAALEEAKKRMVERQKEEDSRVEHIKKDQHMSFTWNVGYYKNEIKRRREELERAERKLRLCEKRARPKP